MYFSYNRWRHGFVAAETIVVLVLKEDLRWDRTRDAGIGGEDYNTYATESYLRKIVKCSCFKLNDAKSYLKV